MKPSIFSIPRAAAVAALVLLSPSAFADSAAAPVPITVLTPARHTAHGLIFLTPNGAATASHGTQIIDDQGRPVWFRALPSGTSATDFRVQRYRGEKVLTWIESQGQFSTGPTTDYIADSHYNVIATVNAGSGLTLDIHEFKLTRENTALVTIYNTVPYDLTAYGGSASGKVTEGVVQEIDIATGHVIFEWHSLDHIGLDESQTTAPTAANTAWDYFHLNAVSVDEDGNLLVGARNTWAAYRLDRHSGKVIWRLAGKKSDFTLGPNVAFAWQHNPTAVDDNGLIRIFDNEASPTVLPYSRVIWVRHDDRRKTATLERWLKHPDGLLAGSQGNSEGLDDGHTFVGWGQLPRFSEFDKDNNLVFDAALPDGYNSYRAWRYDWDGKPATAPTATATTTSDGDTVVHAIWNGATEVASWDVLDASRGNATGDDKNNHGHHNAQVVASAAWNGLDTTIQVDGFVSSVVVVAKDREGHPIGKSAEVTATQQ
ncbi:MAG TPA: arylsulfotransferase family protein [Polyangiaceae bacterium]|nr:arylsulfotransferase family protein [Polyangiaceae bacterium]